MDASKESRRVSRPFCFGKIMDLGRITVGITGYGEKSQPSQKIAQAVLRCIPWLSAIMFTLVTATYEAVSRNASVAKRMRLRQICRR
ncbi:hypothetical protein LF1_52160 [Rubripirellula obstinata]|uniref:Uncharacterized protein n=1 Tax=Rubripirellula obstinata TaxID=406547 RepID=A0A5B1C8E4_9BACT|nr:hypothetical protein LF1_52160 [Rubripirellula obstinata]